MTPNPMNTDGQPRPSMRVGATVKPTTVPMFKPPKTMLVALDLSFTGTYREITSTAAGGLTPSPSPTRRRDRESHRMSPATKGTAAVAMLHRATPNGRTLWPPNLFASQPPGSCAKRYP